MIAPEILRVLLVEDNDGDAHLVVDSLAGEPVEVRRVVRLQSALQELATGGFDVVLLDLSLPDATELEGIRGVRSAAPFVPLVVLTGSVDHRLGARALADGAHDYLLKGEIEPQMLARALRSARERQRYLDAVRARAEDDELASREQLSRRPLFIAKVSQVLNGTLDAVATLSAVAIAGLPELGDWCVVQVKDDSQRGYGRRRAARSTAARRRPTREASISRSC